MKRNELPPNQVLQLFQMTGDKKTDLQRYQAFEGWISHRREFGPHDSDYLMILERAVTEHENCYSRFTAIRALARLPKQAAVVDLMIRCVSEFDVWMGDLYFPFEALSHLEQFKPLTFNQYDTIRKALVLMLRTPSAFKSYSYSGGSSSAPFAAFINFTPEPERSVLWPEFIRELVDGDPITFTRALTTLVPYGAVFNTDQYINHILRNEHPTSAMMLRVYILHEIAQCKQYLINKNIDPAMDPGDSVVLTLEKYREILSQSTEAELNSAQTELDRLASTIDLTVYFEDAHFIWLGGDE